MSKLNDLIAELCPNDVEWKEIRNIVKVNRGSRLTKSQLSDEFEYEVYHGSKDTPLGKYSDFNVPANTTIVVNTGGIGGVKFLDKPFWCSDGSFWLGHSKEIDDKYLYYCLSGYENYFFTSLEPLTVKESLPAPPKTAALFTAMLNVSASAEAVKVFFDILPVSLTV